MRLSAAHIILVHNHPSGGMEPSLADVETTKALVEVGIMMGVYVLDHIIVSHGDYVSIRQSRLNFLTLNEKGLYFDINLV